MKKIPSIRRSIKKAKLCTRKNWRRLRRLMWEMEWVRREMGHSRVDSEWSRRSRICSSITCLKGSGEVMKVRLWRRVRKLGARASLVVLLRRRATVQFRREENRLKIVHVRLRRVRRSAKLLLSRRSSVRTSILMKVKLTARLNKRNSSTWSR